MRLRFLFVGRTKSSYLAAGVDDYFKRIKPYAQVEEVIIRGGKADDSKVDAVRAEDSKRLLAAVKADDIFVHLDPDGRELTSLELAGWLKDQWERGAGAAAFGLGGPLGLDEQAAARADLRLCLSRLTLTHEMSRLVLLEQIYRAFRINAGHPYHK
ncbi:MAG: 23S rRNA (pseudouridine(1915)-N(3))-methyltransferase RlmH [Pseudomonadota bacterium]